MDSQGHPVSTNTYKNMPMPDVFPVVLNMSPDGKLLAVAGGIGGIAGLSLQWSGADYEVQQGADDRSDQLDSLGQGKSSLCAGTGWQVVRVHDHADEHCCGTGLSLHSQRPGRIVCGAEVEATGSHHWWVRLSPTASAQSSPQPPSARILLRRTAAKHAWRVRRVPDNLRNSAPAWRHTAGFRFRGKCDG